MLNFTLFTRDLLDQIVPLVNGATAWTPIPRTARDWRAVDGRISEHRDRPGPPELFGYVLAYSGGFGALGPQPPSVAIETQSPWKELLASEAATKKHLRLLFLGSGQQETGMRAPGQQLVRRLQERG